MEYDFTGGQEWIPWKQWITGSSSSHTLSCAWCGKDLSTASQVKYLNGNQPVCDLCLLKTKEAQ